MAYFDWFGFVEESDHSSSKPISIKFCKDVDGSENSLYDNYWCIDSRNEALTIYYNSTDESYSKISLKLRPC
jgi:hypothetical protein